VGVLRHLGLERVAHEERGDAPQRDHRHQPPVGPHLAEQPPRIGQPHARAGRLAGGVRVAGVGRAGEKDRERHVDGDVGEQPPGRTQRQHEPTAHRGPEQDRQVPAARVEADRARQMVGADHVVDDQLRRRRADHAGGAVQEQDHDGVPDPQRPGEEEHAPGDRGRHEEGLRHLDQLAAVVAVGQGAGVEREEQERHPVADDGEAAERRRVEGLEHDPVADDVLDVVRRHRHEAEREVAPVVGGVQGREAREGCHGAGRASGHRRDRTTRPGGCSLTSCWRSRPGTVRLPPCP